MYQIVCEAGNGAEANAFPTTVASGFMDDAAAKRTLRGWLSRHFPGAAPIDDNSWQLHADGRVFRVRVEHVSAES